MIATAYIGPSRPGELTRRLDNPREWRVQRKTALELVRFVADVVDGRIFLAQQVQPFDDVGCVFPAIGFLHDITADARAEIGTFFEYRLLACGRGRKGQPCFATVQSIHREDWLRARDMIAAEVIRREKRG
jgi:hypothetical protein